MKTQLINLQDLKKMKHPASKLFRTIELRAVYEQTKNILFRQPSMDLGGGDGYLSSILFDKKFSYNVDNGEANDLHIAKRFKRYRKILVESAEKMSLKDGSLNFIFSNSVIEHIPNNEAVLKEVSRTLKKGGAFVFTSPSHNFKHYLWLSNFLSGLGLSVLGNLYLELRNKILNHYHTYSHQRWTAKLKKHGLIVKKHKYYISKEICMLWDRIAWEVRVKSLFDRNAETKIYHSYKQRIADAIARDTVRDTQGASLFIYAIKK